MVDSTRAEGRYSEMIWLLKVRIGQGEQFLKEAPGRSLKSRYEI